MQAQEEFVEPSRFLTKFHFTTLTGGVVLFKAIFDVYPDTLNFILDTGSGGISLDSTTAEYFGLKGEPSDRTIRGIAGIRKVRFLNNRKLHMQGLTADSLNFHINNYEILSSVYGERIDGIVGYSVFRRYIIKLNYDSSYIEIWSNGSMRYPRGGFLLKPVISTLAVQPARIRDEKTVDSRFLFDIGAGLNLMLSSDFIKDSSFLQNKRKLYPKQGEGLGGKIDMYTTVIKELKLGPYKFRKVPVEIFDDTYNVTSYPYLAGLIGNDLLRRFNAIINYDKRDIYLVPNSHFDEPFDYSYTGIELYLVNGKIIIGDVARDSPADKAGLKEGDIVFSINNNFTQNIQLYKATIQNSGEQLRMIIVRDGSFIEYKFKVKSIL